MQMREEKRKNNHLGWLNRAAFPACHLLRVFTCCQAREENKGEGNSPPAAVYGLQRRAKIEKPQQLPEGNKISALQKVTGNQRFFWVCEKHPGKTGRHWLCELSVSPSYLCGRACIENLLLEIGKTARTCHLGQKHGTPALWVGLEGASREGVEEGRIHKPLLAFWGSPCFSVSVTHEPHCGRREHTDGTPLGFCVEPE